MRKKLTQSEHQHAREGNFNRTLEMIDAYYDVEITTDFNILLNIKDEGGWTVLSWAVYWREISVVSRLLDLGAKINSVNNRGVSPLLRACLHCNSMAVIRLLLERGADPNIADQDGDCPLLAAITCRVPNSISTQAVRLLLQHGAYPNHRNKEGSTPLHLSCQDSLDSISRMLIGCGGWLDCPDNDNQMPIDFESSRTARQMLLQLYKRRIVLEASVIRGWDELPIHTTDELVAGKEQPNCNGKNNKDDDNNDSIDSKNGNNSSTSEKASTSTRHNIFQRLRWYQKDALLAILEYI